MKKVLIVGGLGYIGGRMAEYLSQKGYEVKISTRKPKKEWPTNLPINTSLIQLNYTSEEQLNNLMRGMECVIHLAGPDAHTPLKTSNQMIKNHVGFTKNLVMSAITHNIKKFIYFSTIHVYGENLKGLLTEETKPIPCLPFAKAHLKAEEIIQSQDSGTKAIIFRCSNTFGAPYFENKKCWNLVVNNLCKSVFDNGKLILKSSGQQYRDFISMENVLNVTYHLLELPKEQLKDKLLNLGSSKTIKIIEMAEKIQEKLLNCFNIDCSIKTNDYSSDKINNSFNISTDKIQKTGWVYTNSDKEINSLIKYCQTKQSQVLI